MVDKKDSEFNIFLTIFFSTEILAFVSLPPYKIAGINPSSLSLLSCPEVTVSLLVAFKLFIFLFGAI